MATLLAPFLARVQNVPLTSGLIRSRKRERLPALADGTTARQAMRQLTLFPKKKKQTQSFEQGNPSCRPRRRPHGP